MAKKIFEIDLTFNDNDAIFTRPLPSQVCWYDCHALPETTAPVTCPMSYPKTKTSIWKCQGKFCSWGCVRRYNDEFLHDTRSSERDMWICVFANKTQNIPLVCNIEMAQPRCRLQAFGGDLTISEFRSLTRITIPPLPNEKKRKFENSLVQPLVLVESTHQADLFLAQECGMAQDDSCLLYDLYSVRHQEHENQKKQQQKVQHESFRLVAHIRGEHNVHSNHLMASLPPIDILRSRMRLPFVGDPSKLQPFNPHIEKSSLEKSITEKTDKASDKKREGYFKEGHKKRSSSAATATLSSSYNNCPSLDLGGIPNREYESGEVPLPKIPDLTKPLKTKQPKKRSKKAC